MSMKLSKVYKRKKKSFRYDYENCLVLWVEKATEEDVKDNKEWIEKYGKPLFEIDEDGYIEIQSVGLSKSNWTDRQARNEYLDEWIYELEEETAYLIDQFVKFG